MRKISEFFVLIAVIAFGGLPSLAFFVWIERNMALPWVGTWAQWPWIFIDAGLAGSIFFDLVLIAIFGLFHSLLAGRVRRAIYVIVAGFSSLFIMAAWQPTGRILYSLIPSAAYGSVFSFCLYWGILVFAFASLIQVESLPRFIGLAGTTEGSTAPANLWTGGLYARIRHPLYSLTFLAWILTPMMSLDRIVFIAGMGAYLAFAVPREERRLREQFGDAYAEYQARTPMLIPRLGAH